MPEESKSTGCIANLVCLTISIGFLIGGGIAYGVFDHVCHVTPEQCDDTQRFTSFVIMCVGGAISLCQCLTTICFVCVAACLGTVIER